ncbi:hypothetical protein IAF28_19675, partial [Acinetobacter baumannii]|uniref:hypothetical protein n=1 Tax=Acinetobacter baumannii TaxID=470 RepID=UPI00165F7F9B
QYCHGVYLEWPLAHLFCHIDKDAVPVDWSALMHCCGAYIGFDPASNIIDSYHSQKAQSHLQSEQEKDYGYNRLVNNVVKEYLDQ